MKSTAVQRFTVTEGWVKCYSTHNRGWTKKQLQILGVSWPPPKGWLRSITGKSITWSTKTRFEDEAIRHACELGRKDAESNPMLAPVNIRRQRILSAIR